MSTTINDNEGVAPTPRTDPDAHGQAALLLAESMVHALVEAKVLTVGQAIAIVDTAAEVKVEVAEAAGESRAVMEHSLELLAAISQSLRLDQ